MADLSESAQKVLLRAYIGQNIRAEGILQSDFEDKKIVNTLIAEGLIKPTQWYNHHLFLTTLKGDVIATSFLTQKLKDTAKQLIATFQNVPPKILSFFTYRYVVQLSVRTEKPLYGTRWEDRLLIDERIWKYWNDFFVGLESNGLCVKAHYYVSSHGGRISDLHYVISPETFAFLNQQYKFPYLSEKSKESLSLYPVLTMSKRILELDDVLEAKIAFNSLLTYHPLNLEKLAEVINCMAKEKITTEFRGLHSDLKPFEIINPVAFQHYLETNLIEKKIAELLEKDHTKSVYDDEASLKVDKISNDFDIEPLDNLISEKQLASAYLLVRTFELDTREFIKDILGKTWLYTLEQSLPNLVVKWKKKQKSDHNWGLRPDKDLLSYADLHDYAIIIRYYQERFIKNCLTLPEIETKLKDVANYGRNPIMHSRNLTQNMLATCQTAQRLLRNWMEEIRELNQN